MLIGGIVLAAVLWWVIFARKPGNFWLLMGAGTAILGGFALAGGAGRTWGRLDARAWLVGAASAVLFYLIFWAGNAAIRAIIPASGKRVDSVYGISAEAHPWLIGALLLAVIGPGEELFWRGFVQHSLPLPAWAALVVASLIYAAVHVVSRNPMLVLAALVGGLGWGALFLLTGQLAPVVVSHALWDVAVLLVLPLSR